MNICKKEKIEILKYTPQETDISSIQDKDSKYFKFISKHDTFKSDSITKNIYYRDKKLRIRIVGITHTVKDDPGASNQDCIGVLVLYKNVILLVLADGVSTSYGSEIASVIAVRTILTSDIFGIPLVGKIKKRLYQELSIIEESIQSDYDSYRESFRKALIKKSLSTTVQALKVNLVEETVQTFKFGDGTIVTPEHNHLDGGGSKTLAISPFLKDGYEELFESSNSQAIYEQVKLNHNGTYALSTDGIDIVMPGWKDELSKTKSFIPKFEKAVQDCLSSYKDNASVISVTFSKVEGIKSKAKKNATELKKTTRKTIKTFLFQVQKWRRAISQILYHRYEK